MEKSNILLISDNNTITKAFKEKLVLLRRFDELVTVSEAEFCENIDGYLPNVIFLVESDDRDLTVQILDVIRAKFKNTSIILVTQKRDFDFALAMYDRGVFDCVFPETPPAEILIKVINAIKRADELLLKDRNNDLLTTVGYLSANSGFYQESCANELMLSALDSLKSLNDTFMIIACDELDRAYFKVEPLISAIKDSVRLSDFVIELKSGKFYLYLKNTDESGAIFVYTKIKEKLNAQFRIKAGIVAITGRSFRDIEQKASISLTDAMLGANDFVVYKDREIPQPDEWILEPEDKQKDFKLFKQLFVKKLDKVITPVFYRMQTAYEGTLGDTKIEQYAHETQCIFHLKNQKQTSRLTIVYPGLAKAVIYVTHSGWDSPENKEIFMPLKQLTEPVLSEILEKFINDFKSCIDN